MNRRGLARWVFLELLWALMLILALGSMIYKEMDAQSVLLGYASRETALFVETLYGVPGDVSVLLPTRLPRHFLVARDGIVSTETEQTPWNLLRLFRQQRYPYMPTDQFPPLDQQLLVYALSFQKTGRELQFGGNWQPGACPAAPMPRPLAGLRVHIDAPAPGTLRGAVDEGAWAAEIAIRLANLLAAKQAVITDEAPDLVVRLGLHDAEDGALVGTSDTPLGVRLGCLVRARLTAPVRVLPDALPLAPLTLEVRPLRAERATMTDPFDALAAALATAIEEAVQ